MTIKKKQNIILIFFFERQGKLLFCLLPIFCTVFSLSDVTFANQPSTKVKHKPSTKVKTTSPESSDVLSTLEGHRARFANEINEVAEQLDDSITPSTKSKKEPPPINKTKGYLSLSANKIQSMNLKTSADFGVDLHLPRFERYWQLKFTSKNKKKQRGQKKTATQKNSTIEEADDSSTENSGAGLSLVLQRLVYGIKLTYEPRLVFNRSLGLDHSFEMSNELFNEEQRKATTYNILFAHEFFFDSFDGAGLSDTLDFELDSQAFDGTYWFKNDSRYISLLHSLNVTHTLGLSYHRSSAKTYSASSSWSYSNKDGYGRSSYVYSLSAAWSFDKHKSEFSITPYLLYEASRNFEQDPGLSISMTIDF